MQPKKGLLIGLCVVFLCETVMFHDDRLIAVFSQNIVKDDDVSKVELLCGKSWLSIVGLDCS